MTKKKKVEEVDMTVEEIVAMREEYAQLKKRADTYVQPTVDDEFDLEDYKANLPGAKTVYQKGSSYNATDQIEALKLVSKGETPYGKSLTVPGQEMTPFEIANRRAAMKGVDFTEYQEGVFVGDLALKDPSKMNKIQKAEYAKELDGLLTRLKDRIDSEEASKKTAELDALRSQISSLEEQLKLSKEIGGKDILDKPTE